MKNLAFLACLAITPARAASPWNGTWTLDPARSSPNATRDAADGYRFTLSDTGAITWEIPSLHEVVTSHIDGRPMPITRPGAPPGLTLGVTSDGSYSLRYTVSRNGKPAGGGVMTLVEGGRAWVDISWQTGLEEHAAQLLYVKTPSNPK